MNDEEPFEKAIQSFPEEIKEIARQTRALIHKIMPRVVEVVWVQQKNIGFGSGVKKNSEHFCWIMPATNHLTLGFNYGAELPDPKVLLEGKGKLFRHFKIKSKEDLSNPDLIEILKYASSYRIPTIKEPKNSKYEK